MRCREADKHLTRFKSAQPGWREVKLTRVLRSPCLLYNELTVTADWAAPADTSCQHTVRGFPPVKLLVHTDNDMFPMGLVAALKLTGMQGTVIFSGTHNYNSIIASIPPETPVAMYYSNNSEDQQKIGDYLASPGQQVLVTNSFSGMECRNLIHISQNSTTEDPKIKLAVYGSTFTRVLDRYVFLTSCNKAENHYHQTFFFCDHYTYVKTQSQIIPKFV